MSALRALFEKAPEKSVPAGGALFRRDDPVHSLYVVRFGRIALERPLTDGTALTLHRASAGMIIAEASLFADSYHCDAVATEPAVVAWLRRTHVLKTLAQSPDAALDLIEAQAKEVQNQRARIEILRLRRVADRLDAWVELNGAPAVGTWTRVADAIGVSPAALYREIARRKRK